MSAIPRKRPGSPSPPPGQPRRDQPPQIPPPQNQPHSHFTSHSHPTYSHPTHPTDSHPHTHTTLTSPPSPTTAPERKRRRKVLSCLPCRRRKLGCDRGYPACTRCRRAGQADGCIYDARLGDDGTGSEAGYAREMLVPTVTGLGEAEGSCAPPPQPPTASDMSVAQRLAQLEALLLQRSSSSSGASAPPAPHPPTNTTSTSTPFPLPWSQQPRLIATTSSTPGTGTGTTASAAMLFRGSGFRTQFYGPTNAIGGGVAQVPGLRAFMQSAIASRVSRGVGAGVTLQAAFEGVRRGWKGKGKDSQKEKGEGWRELVDLLPPEKSVCDALVAVYLRNWEVCWRVLVLGEFGEMYGRLWEWLEGRRREEEECPVPEVFLATLLLVCAIGRVHVPMASSSGREQRQQQHR